MRWVPESGSALVLLDYGDLLTREIEPGASLGFDSQRLHRSPAAQVAARGNAARRLGVEKVIDHADKEAQWQAFAEALVADPWAAKEVLELSGRGDVAVVSSAALESSSHSILPDLRTMHAWSLRTSQGLTPSGPALTITGGWYNPAGSGGGITIIVTIPGGGSLPPEGGYVRITGANGLPSGVYRVTGSSGGGGSGRIEVEDDGSGTEREEHAGVVGGSANGTVDMRYPTSVEFYGLNAAWSYRYSVNGGGSFTSISGDSVGRATVNPGLFSSRISYTNWYGIGGAGPSGPLPNPLPIDGQDQTNRDGQPLLEDGPGGFAVVLEGNDGSGWEEMDRHEFVPSWSTRKTFTGSTAAHTLDSVNSLTFTLRGPDDPERARLPVGSPEVISGGEAQPLSA